MPEGSTTAKLIASGKVIFATNGTVVFNPTGTRYELHLVAPKFDGPLHTPVKCIIRASARKVYTVPSGGNYITPILGTPRIVQGLVRSADARELIVQAGCPIHVTLPTAESAIDLDDGPIYLGKMVNVVDRKSTRL